MSLCLASKDLPSSTAPRSITFRPKREARQGNFQQYHHNIGKDNDNPGKLVEQATRTSIYVMVAGSYSFGWREATHTGSWNVAVRPKDGLSSATSEEQYTASTPVDTREFMSGDKRLSDASPDLIRLAPGTTIDIETRPIDRARGWGSRVLHSARRGCNQGVSPGRRSRRWTIKQAASIRGVVGANPLHRTCRTRDVR